MGDSRQEQILEFGKGSSNGYRYIYHSQVYQLIRDGVSDMHCMSDAYLAEELKQEYAEKSAG